MQNHAANSRIDKLLQDKRREVLKLAEKHGAFNVRIFGSVARGEADEQSDIDFLVDYSLEKISPWFPAGLVLDLEQLLGCNVDIATEAALKDRIKDRVLNEAVPL
jgi:predicted nucleotidyltransferase